MAWGPRRVTALLEIVMALAVVAPASAHDSLGPAGSPHTWLPSAEWVPGHWIPFDEQALKEELGLRGRDLEAYLYNDHHTLANLARARGIDREKLADRLIEPWRATASVARLTRLRDLTMRILTQGHLAQHAFFHVFHGVPVRAAAPSVFGVSEARYRRMRLRGHTPLEIARRGGVSRAAVKTGMMRVFRARRDEGIRRRLAWAPESERILKRQVRMLSCWLRRTIPAEDPGNPYGKARHQHGHHRRAWPGTPAQRRRDERRVERLRRSLHPSCWRPPPPWSWTAHGVRPF